MKMVEPFVRIFASASPRFPHTTIECQSVRSWRCLFASR